VVGSLAETLTPAGATAGLKKAPVPLKKLVPADAPVLPATFAAGFVAVLVDPGWPATAASFMAARRVFGVA
jgi:hypothetical protein